MNLRWISLIGLMSVFFVLHGFADEKADKKDMGGWEQEGAYNQLYNIKEIDSFKATVVGFKTEPPMPGMSPGVMMLVRESDDAEIITVQVCPLWFANPQRLDVKRGDRVKIRGAWAEIGGKEVLMAAKIKKGEKQEFKVRLSSNGKPFWTMSAEELAKESQTDTD
jgi:hypothetical protein